MPSASARSNASWRPTSPVIDTAAAFSREAVEEFRETMGEKLEGVESDLQALRDRAVELEGDAREAIEETIQDLEHDRDELEALLADTAVSTQQAWDDLRQGASEAWDHLSRAANDAVSRYGVGSESPDDPRA